MAGMGTAEYERVVRELKARPPARDQKSVGMSEADAWTLAEQWQGLAEGMISDWTNSPLRAETTATAIWLIGVLANFGPVTRRANALRDRAARLTPRQLSHATFTRIHDICHRIPVKDAKQTAPGAFDRLVDGHRRRTGERGAGVTIWWDIPTYLQRQVQAAVPVALKILFEKFYWPAYRIDYQYSSDEREWWARPTKRKISVPAFTDMVTAFICGHETAHVIAGSCPETGDHQRIPGVGCLRCEHLAWEICTTRLMPFIDQSTHTELRRSLSTYRRGIAAPATARHDADRLMGSVSWATQYQTQRRFAEQLERQRLANESVQRERAREQKKRDRWNELLARQARAMGRTV